MNRSALVAALWLAGMVPATAVDRPAKTYCIAGRASFAIGSRPTPGLVERVRRRSGSAEVRVLQPGSVVTMEYRDDRVNLTLSQRGRIVRVHCG